MFGIAMPTIKKQFFEPQITEDINNASYPNILQYYYRKQLFN